MKRNAIIRIIAWTVSLVILVGLLVLGMNWKYHKNGSYDGVTMIEATEAPGSGNTARISATVIEESGLFRSPSPESQQVTLLPAGTSVTITRRELVGGSEWAYIVSPDSGWIPADRLRLADSGTSPARIDGAAQFSADLREIEIDWVSGNIRLVPANVSSIEVSESGEDTSKYPMICRQDGQTLKIEYCTNTIFGDLKNLKFSKDLTIFVPLNWSGRALKVDAASAKLSVQDVTIQEAEIDTASGSSRFDNCTVDSLDIDTASGDVYFEGSLNRLDFDSASAGVQAVLSNVPYEIDMDTASGGLELFLPEDAGFSVKMDTMSGKFDSTLTYTEKSGRFVRGNGACSIDMSSMSGGVTIRSK